MPIYLKDDTAADASPESLHRRLRSRLDGMALAQQMRQRGLDTPLVALTARTDAEAEPRARAAGFDDFVRKPVTGDMLAAVIASHERGARASGD